MSATGTFSSTLWMVALVGPSSITCGQTWAMKRPSLVPPVVESSVLRPVSSRIASRTASTTGGTSDGRFIAQVCPQVIELGPTNATIHKIDEHVPVADIEPLKNIYRRTLERLAQQAAA